MNREVRNKTIFKNTLYLYLRMIITMLVSFYTSRVLLDVLGENDYGLYNVVGGVVVIIAFINKAMSTSSLRYITFEIGKKDFKRLKIVLNSSLHVHGIISLIILVIGETIGLWFFYNVLNISPERYYAAFWVYQFSLLSTVISILNVPYLTLIIANEKLNFYSLVSIIEVLLKLIFVFVIANTAIDKLVLFSFLMFFSTLIVFFIYKIYCNRQYKESKFLFQINKPTIISMLKFASWNLFGNLASVTYTQGLNVILNIFYGTAINAARGIAVQVQSAVAQFVGNFQTSLNPQITKSFAKKDLNDMYYLLFKSSKYSFLLLFIIVVPIIFRTEQLLSIWLKTIPDNTIVFVRIILIITLIDTLANPIMTSVAATGKVKYYQIIVGSVLLLILPFSFLSLKMGYRPESVFYIHLFFSVIAQCIRLFFINKLIKLSIRMYLKEVIYPIVIVSMSSFIIYLFHTVFHKDLFGLLFFGLCTMLIISFFIYSFALNLKERVFIKNLIKKRFNFLIR